MKIHILLAALIASVAFAAPAGAASKKKQKKVFHRTHIGTVHSKANSNSAYDVYVSGELVGRDPDPSIRAFMMRNPHIWDGPE